MGKVDKALAALGEGAAQWVVAGLKVFGKGIPFYVMGITLLFVSFFGIWLQETKEARVMESGEEIPHDEKLPIKRILQKDSKIE